MLVTTTNTIDGAEISEYFGIVTGEAILGANIFKDLFAGIRNVVGGRAAAYENELSEARRLALEEMTAEARRWERTPLWVSTWTTRPSTSVAWAICSW